MTSSTAFVFQLLSPVLEDGILQAAYVVQQHSMQLPTFYVIKQYLTTTLVPKVNTDNNHSYISQSHEFQ